FFSLHRLLTSGLSLSHQVDQKVEIRSQSGNLVILLRARGRCHGAKTRQAFAGHIARYVPDRLRGHATKIGDGIGKTAIVDGERAEIHYLSQCNDINAATTREIRNDQFQRLPFSWTRARSTELRGGERNSNPALQESGGEERLNALRCRDRYGLGSCA